jgi:predicted CoA-binding protein
MGVKMKQFAIIGCGAVSQFHAKAIQALENGNLYGVYDTRREIAEKFASEYKGCKVFSTLDELFSCKEVDIVNICVPSGLHAELAIKAAQAGKHIIVEKPMAITKEQLKAAGEAGIGVLTVPTTATTNGVGVDWNVSHEPIPGTRAKWRMDESGETKTLRLFKPRGLMVIVR